MASSPGRLPAATSSAARAATAVRLAEAPLLAGTVAGAAACDVARVLEQLRGRKVAVLPGGSEPVLGAEGDAECARVGAQHGVHEPDDAGGGAVVLAQVDHLAAPGREPLDERGEDRDVRAPEPVDGLLGVADGHAERCRALPGPALGRPGHPVEDLRLQAVHVLVLVHEERAHPGPDLGADRGDVAQQVPGPHQQVVEVEHPRPGLRLRVTPLHLAHQVGHRRGDGRCGDLGRREGQDPGRLGEPVARGQQLGGIALAGAPALQGGGQVGEPLRLVPGIVAPRRIADRGEARPERGQRLPAGGGRGGAGQGGEVGGRGEELRPLPIERRRIPGHPLRRTGEPAGGPLPDQRRRLVGHAPRPGERPGQRAGTGRRRGRARPWRPGAPRWRAGRGPAPRRARRSRGPPPPRAGGGAAAPPRTRGWSRPTWTAARAAPARAVRRASRPPRRAGPGPRRRARGRAGPPARCLHVR